MLGRQAIIVKFGVRADTRSVNLSDAFHLLFLDVPARHRKVESSNIPEVVRGQIFVKRRADDDQGN